MFVWFNGSPSKPLMPRCFHVNMGTMAIDLCSVDPTIVAQNLFG